ncbi:E3 ubiquitin-protein ligase COP1, partial [Vitis vinifera]
MAFIDDKHSSGIISSAHSTQGRMGAGSSQNKKADVKAQVSSHGLQRKDAYSGSDSHVTQSGLVVARKRRLHAQIVTCKNGGIGCGNNINRKKGTQILSRSRLRVIAELRHGDLFHSANIVSSIEFDRDDELFATAGVSRRIKVFEFSSVVNEPADVHCPVVEMSTRSKLSCLSWNKYTKNHIASSDYEGIVTVWDVTTR